MNSKFLFPLALCVIFTVNSCKKEDQVIEPILTTATVLPCDFFSTDRTLTNDINKDVDYIVECVMDITANVIIQPGVVIQFRENTGLYLTSGFIKSLGTALQPVILTGTINIPGSWRGIYIASSSLQNEFIHTKINYAGGSAFDSNGDRGAFIFYGTGSTKIDNCEIFKSGHFGLNAPYSGTRFQLTNTLFKEGLRSPINIQPENMSIMNFSNTFLGHTNNFIGVQSGSNISESMTILASKIPYRFYRSSTITDWLTIESGTITINDSVRIQFDDGMGLYISTGGSLKIITSAAAPAVFTAINPALGAWKGIYFETSQADNRIENSIIEFSGNLYDNKRFGVAMYDNPRITILNTTFRNINGCGIVDYQDAINPNPNFIQNNNTFLNNSSDNICFN